MVCRPAAGHARGPLRRNSEEHCEGRRAPGRGKFGGIFALAMPSATISTTVATGMRSPRLQGTPPQLICLHGDPLEC